MKKGFIIKIIAGVYHVDSEGEIYQCSCKGKFRFDKIKPLVGDDVIFDEKEKVITETGKRKSELVRPSIANIDQALIVSSFVEPSISASLIDRFICVIEDHNITPVICLSKLDKIKLESEDKNIIDYYKSIGYKVVIYSAKTKEGLEEISAVLQGKKSILTGQSGVGKTTLLNALIPDLKLEEGEYSKALGRGKHKTRETTLYKYQNGWIADSPGFSSLELKMDPVRLAAIYPGYNEHFDKCKYRGCLHMKESNCEIKRLVDEGVLSRRGYENYISFQKEISGEKEVFTKK